MSLKPKLLFFATRPPLPAVDGTREHIFAELKALAPFFQIDLFLATDEKITPSAKAELEKTTGGQIFNFYRSKFLSRLRVLTRLFSSLPLQVSYFYSSKTAREFIRLADNYQVFYCHTLRPARYFKDLEYSRPDIKDRTLLDLNDAISLNYHHAAKRAVGTWRLIYAWEKNRIKNYELSLMKDFKYFSIVTDRDRDWLADNWRKKYGQIPIKPIQVLRYGVKDSFLDYTYQPQTMNLVFIGNLYYPPNRQGLNIFIKTIWPLVIKKLPESQLLIIGRGAKELFSKYRQVEALGFLADPYEMMVKQAAFLNPITFGAGISTKNVLALALGLPVISTNSGVAGVEKIDQNNNVVLIDYRKPEKSALTVISLLEDLPRRQMMSRQEKALASALYRESINNQALIELMRKIATEAESHYRNDGIGNESRISRAG